MSPAELDRIGTALFGERYQSDLASALGVTRGAVSHWMNEKPVPGPVIAALYAWMEIFEATGIRPPISPGSNERFSPGKLNRRGRPPKYARLLA